MLMFLKYKPECCFIFVRPQFLFTRNTAAVLKLLLTGAATFIHSHGNPFYLVHMFYQTVWGKVNLARQAECFLTPSGLSHGEM